MDVLVLGGTVFLGRAVVAEALAAGDSVTVFNRGRSGPASDRASQLVGDRTIAADLEQLAGGRFDVVVDSSGYVPVDVDASARLLAGSCRHYSFVSSINAFPGWPEAKDYRAGGVHDGDPDATRADAPADESAAYGWLKVGCELAALRAFGPDRTALLRAGCIVGPHDSAVGRLPWWINRVARGGDVLVPGGPDDPVSVIDCRDLARFALLAPPGTFETTAPPISRGELMAACRAATGSDAVFSWVDSDWLAGQDVAGWTEIPLWLPDAPSLFAHDASAARASGLATRPIADTVADTWAWQQSVPGGWRPSPRTPGLSPAREESLLDAWRG